MIDGRDAVPLTRQAKFRLRRPMASVSAALRRRAQTSGSLGLAGLPAAPIRALAGGVRQWFWYQGSLLRLSRTSVCRLMPLAGLAIMHRVDALHLERPFAGSRVLRDKLRAAGIVVGRLAVAEALARHGKPGIFNTDQGGPLISAAFTGMLAECVTAIGMDGQGAWRDSLFVERLWPSVKCEEAYLRAYDSVSDA